MLRRHRAAITVVLAALVLLTGGLVVADKSSRVAGTAQAGPISGLSMPSGDLPGWHRIFADDFDRLDLGDDWGAYDGVPGGDPNSLWRSSNAVVTGHALVLQGTYEGDRLTTAGVSNWPVSQTYGRWEVRARIDPSDDMTFAFLLWPHSGDWPPEIDFLEDWGGDRQNGSAYVHWKTPDTANGRAKAKQTLDADLTTWHTIGVEWMPGKITYLLDGEPWGEHTGPTVPDEPMWMALQAAQGGCELRANTAGSRQCPIVGQPADPRIEIDWVVIYEPAELPS